MTINTFSIEKYYQKLDCKVLDRTNLILDIFAQRAETSYARTQVELAQCQYFTPFNRNVDALTERQRGIRGQEKQKLEQTVVLCMIESLY